MEGDGLRAEGKTMDGRDLTPSGMSSGADLDGVVCGFGFCEQRY